MRIENGFFIQLVDEYKNRVLYSVSTDTVNEDEFNALWVMVGKQIRRSLIEDRAKEQGQFEFKIRAGRVAGI